MNVTGEREKLWVNHHEREDGSTWDDYNVGISTKKQDGSYTNMYVRLKFAKAVQLPDKIHNGCFVTFKGFLTVDSYKDKNGNEVKKPMIMAMEATIDDGERKYVPSYDDVAEDYGFEMADDSIPF